MKVEQAVACFNEHFNCAQALLSVYAPDLGMARDTAFRIATAFGGGMGRMGETCGAVTGAFMVVGLKYGRDKADDKQSKERTYELVKEFVNRFVSRHGSILCRELLGCDLSTPEGRQFAKDHKLVESVCPQYVRTAAEIIEEIG